MHSVLLVDISSGTISVGLAGIRGGFLPELVYTGRQEFSRTAPHSAESLEFLMLRALGEELRRALRLGAPRLARAGYPAGVDHASVILSSPWFVSTIEVGNDRLIRRIEEEVIRAFGLRRGISLQTFPHVFSSIFLQAFGNVDYALFADVNAHTTDLLLVHDKDTVRTASLPFGLVSTDKDMQVAYWDTIRHAFHPRELADVYVTSDGGDNKETDRAKLLVLDALPNSRISAIGPDNNFTELIVRRHPLVDHSERLSLAASFSNMFL